MFYLYRVSPVVCCRTSKILLDLVTHG
jgi:hypothetical protein